MSEHRILRKRNFSYWMRQMRKEMELIGPLRQRGDIVFSTIERIHEIALDCPALIPSPKEFLFPQFEAMMKSSDGKVTDLANPGRSVVVGVRSCDISAANLVDRFFLEGFRDPYYAMRRENTLFISVACNVPEKTCFCNGLGTGPFLKDGFDIQLFDLGDRYLVECGSNRALKWIKGYTFLFERVGKADLEDQYEVQLSSQAMFQKRVSLEGARKTIEAWSDGDDFWREVAERCFECGGCVYECPVCTCFTVMDRTSGSGVERSRLWDTCLFKGFTRMAGNVLPARDRMLRTKRWFSHKLLHYPETLGAFGCVGCGRCAVTCPGRIDMASVVARMK